jgi:hypothetical protein
VVGAARDDQRRVIARDDARRTRDADQPRARGQHQAARAINARRKNQRQPCAREAVDRLLQRLGLVVLAVEADAEMHRIDAEPGDRNSTGRGRSCDGFRRRIGAGGGSGSKEMTTVDAHGAPPERNAMVQEACRHSCAGAGQRINLNAAAR